MASGVLPPQPIGREHMLQQTAQVVTVQSVVAYAQDQWVEEGARKPCGTQSAVQQAASIAMSCGTCCRKD